MNILWTTPILIFLGTAIVFIILFILVFCLVIMNLLVGLAVSDIESLMKTGKRDQLISQIEIINSVLKFRSTKLFQLLARMGCFRKFPVRVQNWFHDDCHKVTVHHSDLNDTRYPLVLKQLLQKHCLDKKKEANKKKRLAENEELKTEIKDVKKILTELQIFLENRKD